jgi:hypothetical protein
VKILNVISLELVLKRLLISLGVILFIRIGSFLPVPGINHTDLALYIEANPVAKNLVSTFSGDNTFVIGLFTLNIFPYINASILVQLIIAFSPSLSKLQKEGDFDDKHLAWVIPIRNCRVIIANEVDKKKNKKNINVNTKLIKSLASGGDRIDGRLLHENSFSFTPNFTIFICSNDGLKVDEDCQDVFENYEEFSYKSKFVKEEDLVEGCSFLKLKDENIKSLIEEPRIYNAYLHYILNSFNNPRLKTPDSVKISTEISKGETVMKIEDFIIKNFKTTHEKNDRLHTLKIQEICNENGYKIELIDCGRIMSRIGIGRYNEKCSVDKIRKSGYEYIKYIGTD